ncbi:M23 family metallopeptidase [Catelliglobosispora koreensis]|uniref:M23 family metallopeptidase n=1 Tax=Catelliglobosispora koreensis TaxID=129052 RepID=UPI00039A482B|nr:M23 family metallopeptidase [Catelliglobosispora koreensis]
MKTPLPSYVAPLRGPKKRLIRPVVLAGTTTVLALLCCAGAVVAIIFGDLANQGSDLTSAMTCGNNSQVVVNGEFERVGSYGPTQIRNAAIIVQTGQKLQIPPRGWVIAVATAMQESSLNNHGHLGDRNDHDSLGLFQQRPSQGWGTAEQIMNPEYSSTKFYNKLLAVPNWELLPLTVAAQRVQISAYPNAYAKHEPIATQIVNKLTGGGGRAVLVNGKLRCAGFGQIAASGWTAPVGANVVSAFRTSQRPSHHGVDLGSARLTPIIAAASGVVIDSRCDSVTCAQDGSPFMRGCGWMVEILHAEQVITRYCHMNTRPAVKVGDRVTVGQVIGIVGTTGNSSGPHLHFEVHLDGDESSRGAVNPEVFMASKGAPLGTPVV